jgi:general secretion pathway protein G
MQTIKNKKQHGFTLVEILVVVAIIGILASIIIPKLTSKVDEARVQKAHLDIKSLSSMLVIYFIIELLVPVANIFVLIVATRSTVSTQGI